MKKRLFVKSQDLTLGSKYNRISSADAEILPRPILNRKENRVFWALDRFVNKNWFPQPLFISAQTSMGEFLRDGKSESKEDSIYWAINSMRVDFCLHDQYWWVKAVIEYNGKGHRGKTREQMLRSKVRDEIKQRACEMAGIVYFEIPDIDVDSEIDEFLEKNLKPLLIGKPAKKFKPALMKDLTFQERLDLHSNIPGMVVEFSIEEAESLGFFNDPGVEDID